MPDPVSAAVCRLMLRVIAECYAGDRPAREIAREAAARLAQLRTFGPEPEPQEGA